jgi:predicted esterase
VSEPELGFVHRFVPAAQGGDGRTLLLLHGTGGGENDLLPLGRELDPAAALLSPRGPVLEAGMPRFFRRLVEGVFDQADVRRRAHALADFVVAASERYGFDRARVWAVGFSNGANIAAAVLLLSPATLAGAALLRAMVPLVPDAPPDLRAVAVLVSAGEADPIVPRGNVERLAGMLKSYGAEVTMRWVRAGHALTFEDVAAVREWLSARRQTPAG